MFIIYSDLQANNNNHSYTDTFRGLGHADSRKDVITISFELAGPNSLPFNAKIPGSKHARKATKLTKVMDTTKTVCIELFQDKTALRSRRGDTGSVLWKARFVSRDAAHIQLILLPRI